MSWEKDGSTYRPNPAYGAGIYRRGVRLTSRQGEVLAELEDTHHGMRVVLQHDGLAVTGLRAETPRTPTTSCRGASFALERLVGTPLSLSQADFYSSAAPSKHCTHLFDLTALALAHATRGEATRRYDVVVPDESGDGVFCTITCNGEVVHRWLISGQTIRKPQAFAGQPVLLGFISWAVKQFSGDELEAALVFQKGFFVSRARRRFFAGAAGRPIAANRSMHGVCFAYQPERVDAGLHIDSTRDFSLNPEDVLTFRS